jgi:hypothetical protein
MDIAKNVELVEIYSQISTHDYSTVIFRYKEIIRRYFCNKPD